MNHAFRQIVAGEDFVLRFEVGVGNFVQQKHFLRIGDAGIFLIDFDQCFGAVHRSFINGTDEDGGEQDAQTRLEPSSGACE